MKPLLLRTGWIIISRERGSLYSTFRRVREESIRAYIEQNTLLCGAAFGPITQEAARKLWKTVNGCVVTKVALYTR